MSMFARNDKAPDTNAEESARQPEVSHAPAISAHRPLERPAQPQPSTAPSGALGVSVISKALKITGQLESTEDIRIDGEVDGDVRGVSVTVGRGAKGRGTVY